MAANWGEAILGGALGGLGGGMGAYAQNQEDQRKFLMDQWYRQQEVKNAADRIALEREKMNAEQRLNYASPEEAQQMMALFHILGGPQQASAIVSGGDPTAAVSTGSPTAAATSAGAGVQGVPASGGGGGGSLQAASAFPQMPGGLVPRGLLNTLITQGAAAQAAMRAEQFKVAQEAAARERQAGAFTDVANASARPAIPPALMGQLAEGEDPEAAAMIPRTLGAPAVPPDPMLLRQATLARGGLNPADILKMEELRQQEPGFELAKRLLAGQDINAPGSAGTPPLSIAGQPVTVNLSGGKIGLQSHLPEADVDRQGLALYGRPFYLLNQAERQEALARVQSANLAYAGAQGLQAAQLAQSQPLKGTELAGYIHRTTGQHPPMGMSLQDMIASKEYVPVAPQQMPALRQVQTAQEMLDSVEQVIMSRPDIWPPSSGSAVQDAAAVSRARLNYTALTSAFSPFKGTDADIAKFESNTAGLPAIARGFGDVGNIAREEQRIAGEAIGLQGAQSREAALARLENVRTLFNGGLRQAGLKLLVSPYASQQGEGAGGTAPTSATPSQDREPIYVRNQQTKERGKWEGTMPPSSGFQEISPWEVTLQGLSTPSRTPGPPGTQMPAARSQAPKSKFIYDPNSNQLFPK